MRLPNILFSPLLITFIFNLIFNNVNNKIHNKVSLPKYAVQITNPSDLRNKFPSHGMIKFKLGNFGKIPYSLHGGDITGRIFWSNAVKDNSFCNANNIPRYSFTEDPDQNNSPIILVDS